MGNRRNRKSKILDSHTQKETSNTGLETPTEVKKIGNFRDPKLNTLEAFTHQLTKTQIQTS